MTSFALYALAAALMALDWTLALAKIDRSPLRFLGVAGAWVAVLVLIALWRAETVPSVWQAIQLVLLLWLLAIGLLVVDVSLSLGKRPPRWWVSAALALTTLAIHVVAGLHFFWLAVVSPGGV